MHENDLKSLSDDELLLRLSHVLKASRRVESVLVAHIAEVDRRRLYASCASSSMHNYCTDVLHLSDAEAYLRITVARASRRFPVLLTMLADGRLHLSGIEVLVPHLTNANCEEFLTRASYKSKRDIQKLVAEIRPKPDVPLSIRKTPERRHAPAPERLATKGPEWTSENPTPELGPTPSGGSNSAREAPKKRPIVEPLSPATYKVQFTASAELHEKLERLASHMPGVDLVTMLDVAVTEKLERLEAKRLGKIKKPRKSLEDADTSPWVRGVSAPVKRFVWDRDQGRCTFLSSGGRRCPERRGLEFHHDEPYRLGGGRGATNVRLLCKTHNLYMAEEDYGKKKMEQFRRSADRVREPTPAFASPVSTVCQAAVLEPAHNP